jgi:uncharacterized protein
MNTLPRLLSTLESSSFILFGPRGVGKTRFLETLPFLKENCLWLNLLNPATEKELSLNRVRLSEMIEESSPTWVVIDEVQKIPQLLDIVHDQIERRQIRFALSGSSARKLRRGGANLLAGRAFVYNMFTLTHVELGSLFHLQDALRWGTLPRLYSLSADEEKTLFLEAYVDTYLREEVVAEQLVRNLAPFRQFLEIAAQTSGTLVNYSAVASDIGVDPHTVKSYFQILEDTLLGNFLPAWDRSVRKQQLASPRFYLFDYGVKRSLEGLVHIPLVSSGEFGRAFEHFIVNEMRALNHYYGKRYKFFHLTTKGGLEVDIVIERPGEKAALIEIRSAENVEERHLGHLASLQKDYPEFEYFCLCRERVSRLVRGIRVLPWEDGLKKLGFSKETGA